VARARRKARPGARSRAAPQPGAPTATEPAAVPDDAADRLDPPRSPDDAMRRGYARGAERDAAIRATLTPLAPGEHPPQLKIAIAVALALAAANLAAFAGGAGVPGSGSRAGGLLFVAVMLLAAWGMWRQRYWAVLGFATLLALIAVVFTLLLLVASNVLAVVVCVAFAASAGWLFWKLIRVMARLQAPQRVS
jgi:hypothetical protein